MKTKVRHVTLALVIATILLSSLATPVSALDSFSNTDIVESDSRVAYYDADSSGNFYTGVYDGSDFDIAKNGNIIKSNTGISEIEIGVEDDVMVTSQSSSSTIQLRDPDTGDIIDTNSDFITDDPHINTVESSDGKKWVVAYKNFFTSNNYVTFYEYTDSGFTGVKNEKVTSEYAIKEDIAVSEDLVYVGSLSEDQSQDIIKQIEYSSGSWNYTNVEITASSGDVNNEFTPIDFSSKSSEVLIKRDSPNEIQVYDKDLSTKKTTFTNFDQSNEPNAKFYSSDILVSASDGSSDSLYLVDNSTANIKDTLTLSNSGNVWGIKDTKSTYLPTSKGFDNDGRLYVLEVPVTNLDSEINNSDSHTSYGDNVFSINSTATFSDSSSKDVTSNVSYNYDSSIVERNSNTNEFYGVSVGTTTIEVTYTGNTGETVTDDIEVTIDKPVQSSKLVYPLNGSSYLVGDDTVQIGTELTYYNGTKVLADNVDLTYDYNSTIIRKVNSIVSNSETFEGKNKGTTDLQSTYTGFDGETTKSTIEVIEVGDPKKVENINIVSSTGLTYDEGEQKDLDIEIQYEDGSGALVDSNNSDIGFGTEDDTLQFNSDNSTIVSINSSTGESTANLYGETVITATWYESWYDNNVTTNTTATVLGDPTNLDYEVKPDEVLRDENVTASDMNAVLNYEDGRSEDITINVSDISSSDPTNTVYDNQQNQVRFTQSNKTYTLTYTEDVSNVSSFSDSDTVTVNPRRDFEDYNNLGVYDRVFVIMSDWTFWAIILSLIAGSLVAIQIGTTAGIGTTTIIIAVAWAGGFVPIYIPISLILIEIFAYITKNSTGASTT